MKKDAKIYIAGHQGMAGSAIHRRLQKEGFQNFILADHSQLDLHNQNDVQTFF